MRKLKICMLGATGVGKTSLVARFVRSIFSEAYLTTVGVTIDKATLRRGSDDIDLIVWDLSGQDEFQSVQLAYLRGSAGYLLVADGTRRETLATAVSLRGAARKLVGNLPVVLVLNKCDLVTSWDIGVGAGKETPTDLDALRESGESEWPIIRTSAKTGEGVQNAFESLVNDILNRDAHPGAPPCS